MQIKTVATNYREKFDEEVNLLLSQGWELHGEPNITSIAQQDTWDGKLRCWTVNVYVQVMKKN